MSLAKLLNVIILILFTIGAALLLVLEITTVRQSILDQMSANLETAITALGLVLQGTLLNDDKVLAETIVNAMFDGGFVNSVVLLDPDGQVLFQKVFHTAQQNVPGWLPSVIDMPPVKIEQELTDGWRILGTLTLEGHKGYAYQHLWNAISRTGLALLAGLLVFSLVITWVCRRLLRPSNRSVCNWPGSANASSAATCQPRGFANCRKSLSPSTSWSLNASGTCCNSGSRSPSLASTTLSRPTRSSLGWSTPMATPISSISSPLRGIRLYSRLLPKHPHHGQFAG